MGGGLLAGREPQIAYHFGRFLGDDRWRGLGTVPGREGRDCRGGGEVAWGEVEAGLGGWKWESRWGLLRTRGGSRIGEDKVEVVLEVLFYWRKDWVLPLPVGGHGGEEERHKGQKKGAR